jgi:hypothetical protein
LTSSVAPSRADRSPVLAHDGPAPAAASSTGSRSRSSGLLMRINSTTPSGRGPAATIAPHRAATVSRSCPLASNVIMPGERQIPDGACSNSSR